jgi:hypothetical protein
VHPVTKKEENKNESVANYNSLNVFNVAQNEEF